MFDGAQSEHQVLLRRCVVVHIFDVSVVQVVVADGYGLGVFAGVMFVGCANGECLLLEVGQITEQIFILFTLFVRIQFHVVDTDQS